MRKLILLLILLCASRASAATYYLATAAGGGSDSNNGTSSGTPWLSPNHAVNCGDVILAAASTSYAYANFQAGKWGTVTCAAGNNVAWLKCATFDACKITVTSGSGAFISGMVINTSYWGVQGWETTAAANTDACFQVYPSGGTTIHHIVFANDIANGCAKGGFSMSDNLPAGMDYIAVVGSIAYNAAQATSLCASGINAYEPVASDTLPGTHYYFAGNFAWGNVNGACNSGTPTDGEGLFFDTFDGSADSITPFAYQSVIDNNISMYNGGRGIEIYQNQTGTPPFAKIYLRHNTIYGNNNQTGQLNIGNCGELFVNHAYNVEALLNIAQTNSPAGCSSNTVYAFEISYGNGSSYMYQDYGYDASGNNLHADNSTGFVAGPANILGTNPSLVNPTEPSAPSCGSASSVPNCMATVIANFTPTTTSALSYGYQIPLSYSVYDPLFPQWLCNVNLPAGLVTMGCLPGSSTH